MAGIFQDPIYRLHRGGPSILAQKWHRNDVSSGVFNTIGVDEPGVRIQHGMLSEVKVTIRSLVKTIFFLYSSMTLAVL
jgi:hypothetical protein